MNKKIKIIAKFESDQYLVAYRDECIVFESILWANIKMGKKLPELGFPLGIHWNYRN